MSAMTTAAQVLARLLDGAENGGLPAPISADLRVPHDRPIQIHVHGRDALSDWSTWLDEPIATDPKLIVFPGGDRKNRCSIHATVEGVPVEVVGFVVVEPEWAESLA